MAGLAVVAVPAVVLALTFPEGLASRFWVMMVAPGAVMVPPRTVSVVGVVVLVQSARTL
jgi:hypothetical protein